MILSEIIDIVNSIAVFQLIFFGFYLCSKGNKIPSTLFLKFFLFSQLIPFVNYLISKSNFDYLQPLRILSVPTMFLWAPTFFFYIRSRLYLDFTLSRKLTWHFLPAFFVSGSMIISFLIKENTPGVIIFFDQYFYFLIQVQLSVYNIYTLSIIYKYRFNLKLLTSVNEKQKLRWLFIITYGFTLTSIIDFILVLIPRYAHYGWGWILFFIFSTLFFYKSVIQPEQFLGLDEKNIKQIKKVFENSLCYFQRIEERVNGYRLFLDPDLSLGNVAEDIKLSERLVSQIIKHNTGQNFSDYINIKRIEYAKNLLLTTTSREMNVLEVLYESGFNSKSVFNSQFKKHTGVSPTTFRKCSIKDGYRDLCPDKVGSVVK